MAGQFVHIGFAPSSPAPAHFNLFLFLFKISKCHLLSSKVYSLTFSLLSILSPMCTPPQPSERRTRSPDAKFITVKPRQVAIISNRTPLRTGKRKEISCETTGSRPPADVHWKLVRPGNEEKLTDFRLVLLESLALFLN